MITKNDCLLLLTELEQSGVKVDKQINTLIKSDGVPLNVLKFINDNRHLDVANFYEQIRKSYNSKKSSLYINIVKEIEEPDKVITTLSAMLTQEFLYSRKVENKKMFLSHARANDILKVLTIYYNTFDSTPAIKLLKIIKADLKALESFKH